MKLSIKPMKKTAWLLVAVVCIMILASFVVWALFATGRTGRLQRFDAARLDYDGSIEAIRQEHQRDAANPDVRPECRPILKSHGHQTERAVVLLPGVSACPHGMAGLADYLYAAGYTVYVPRTPHHGLRDQRQHGLVTADELVDFMNTVSANVAGLGREVGIIGMSGGATLATWMVHHGDGRFARMVQLSPFYEPSADQVPGWQVSVLRNVYGKHLLPDQFFEGNLSYWTLANYLVIRNNYRHDMRAEGLRHVGVVVSEGDKLIDKRLAHDIPNGTARASGAGFLQRTLPAAMGLEHEIVSLDAAGVAANREEIFKLFRDVYEGRE